MANGVTTSCTAKASSHGLMATTIEEISKMIRKTGKVSSHGMMAGSMTVNGLKANNMAKVSILTRMDKHARAFGKVEED